jgi:RNA polymerase sigma-70 factor (ECF subfamily)
VTTPGLNRVASRRIDGAPRLADSRSDAALVNAARSGDDAAFEALVARHARAALAVARAVVSDVDSAEDVCQDALFHIWKRLGECREPEKFARWMAIAVRRHALNAIRGDRDMIELSTDFVSGLRPPDEDAETAEARAQLDAALDQLSSEQRQAVLLFDLEGWPHAEIAASLGTTEAMSRQHLMLGRRRLRELLSSRSSNDR